MDKRTRFRGCLLGGAVGDALGAPVEFMSLEQIREQFGRDGVRNLAPAYGRVGAITDDTQMTLFTAEGLIRSFVHPEIDPVKSIYQSYLAWLYTQTTLIDEEFCKVPATPLGWLVNVDELNEVRAPGNTCLLALCSGKMGTVKACLNDSKGCGGVMRVAPIGLAGKKAFLLARDAAAITHSHPAGYLSAGVLAEIISGIVNGGSLAEAIDHSVYKVLPRYQDHEETSEALDRAIKLAADPSIRPEPETIEEIGGGWVGEEALAIAIYCSLVCKDDLRSALLLAANHSGDSDSTAAITGNILGAWLGVEAIPTTWLERLELCDVIEEIADDLMLEDRERIAEKY